MDRQTKAISELRPAKGRQHKDKRSKYSSLTSWAKTPKKAKRK